MENQNKNSANNYFNPSLFIRVYMFNGHIPSLLFWYMFVYVQLLVPNSIRECALSLSLSHVCLHSELKFNRILWVLYIEVWFAQKFIAHTYIRVHKVYYLKEKGWAFRVCVWLKWSKETATMTTTTTTMLSPIPLSLSLSSLNHDYHFHDDNDDVVTFIIHL